MSTKQTPATRRNKSITDLVEYRKIDTLAAELGIKDKDELIIGLSEKIRTELCRGVVQTRDTLEQYFNRSPSHPKGADYHLFFKGQPTNVNDAINKLIGSVAMRGNDIVTFCSTGYGEIIVDYIRSTRPILKSNILAVPTAVTFWHKVGFRFSDENDNIIETEEETTMLNKMIKKYGFNTVGEWFDKISSGLTTQSAEPIDFYILNDVLKKYKSGNYFSMSWENKQKRTRGGSKRKSLRRRKSLKRCKSSTSQKKK